MADELLVAIENYSIAHHCVAGLFPCHPEAGGISETLTLKLPDNNCEHNIASLSDASFISMTKTKDGCLVIPRYEGSQRASH